MKSITEIQIEINTMKKILENILPEPTRKYYNIRIEALEWILEIP